MNDRRGSEQDKKREIFLRATTDGKLRRAMVVTYNAKGTRNIKG